MQSTALVRTEHLNHYGRLFGGQLLRWVDEFAWIAATRDFPASRFVTRAMDKVEFRHQVKNGEILTFDVHRSGCGRSSVRYQVTVRAQSPAENMEERQVFSTEVVFAAVDENGRKAMISRK